MLINRYWIITTGRHGQPRLAYLKRPRNRNVRLALLHDKGLSRQSKASPKLCTVALVALRELVRAAFDVVVESNREDYEDPHGKDAHSGDGFGDQTGQNRPSTAKNSKEEQGCS